MTCGIEIIKGLAAEDVGFLAEVATADGATRVAKEKQPDGTWTLTSVYAPCPDGTDPLVISAPGVPKHKAGSAETTPDAFIRVHLDAAKAVKKEFKVPISATLSQSAVESGWGRSVVANAYFGIKAGSGHHTVTFLTHEIVNGQSVSQEADFRAYTSYEDSAMDYGRFLTENPRYRDAFLHTDSPEAFVTVVAMAGYAGGPNSPEASRRKYADLLISIMRGHGLEPMDRV